MTEGQFEVTDSITWRLKAVMMAIALFFILSALGIYVSSLGFLSGLRDINAANKVLTLSTQSIEGLDTSNENLEKLSTPANLRDIKFAFNESQKVLRNTINEAIKASQSDTQVRALLQKGLESISSYETAVNNLFLKYSQLPTPRTANDLEDLKSEILIVNQFAIDSKEYLRKAQINLRHDTETLFDSIYRSRFRPLLVAITLSAFFFLFVITFGFSIAKKISQSVQNLRNATDFVRRGNLSYQAPVLENNEFGILTDTFNKMITSLREGREELDQTLERINRLQKITAAFSKSFTVDEVMEVAVHECFERLNLIAGAISIVSNNSMDVEIKRFYGYLTPTAQKWQRYSLDLDTPVTKVIKSKAPLFLGSKEEIQKTFPSLATDVETNKIMSLAVIPLVIGENCFGTLNFSFPETKKFTNDEKEFLLAIGGQCSQAFHRSKLYDDSKKAIEARDEFLSIASHELKTPLTPLKLQLQILSKQVRSGEAKITDEKMTKIMDNSDRQLGRLSKLIEDLLDVSRITSGRLRLNLEHLDLTQIVEDVLVQYGHQLKDSHVLVEVDADKNIMGFFDQMRVEQVLVNLLTNAAKYAPGKPIKISVRKMNSRARICIKDQGPGIEKVHQERIFQRFERVKEKDNIGGLGLGLYISKQIIEAHNGRIYVDSNPGCGAEFVIELPVDA